MNPQRNRFVKSRTIPATFKSALHAVASPSDTRTSDHPLSLAPAKGKCRLSRWRPNGSLPGTATTFGIARATQSTGGDVWDQSSPKPSGDEKTKSFGEDEHPQWSTSAGSGSLLAQAIGSQRLRVGSLGLPGEEQATKRGVEPCALDPAKVYAE